MNPALLSEACAPAGALSVSSDGASRKFRLACRLLRGCGALDVVLPDQRKGESPIDWMVRHQLAPSPQAAAEALLAARGRQAQRDELLAMPGLNF